jgi:hypothetical protein
MISMTRNQVRRLRTVFRRSVLGINHRSILAPLVLRAEGHQLRAQHRYSDLAVEFVEQGNYRPMINIAVPLDSLADFEGRNDSPVVLEAVAPDRTVVRWEDRGIPQSREYHIVTAADEAGTLPDLPTNWASNSFQLLNALTEATATGDPDSRRYALDCLELRGTAGQIVATDGRQGLIQSGFRFPWDGNLLIRGSPLFANRTLPRDQPIQVGKTDTHVVFRIADWTIWCAIPKDVRFPEVERVIPEPTQVTSRLQLDPEDARFLDSALARLPGADERNSPVTVDLNGVVAIRATTADQPDQVTELVLSRSAYRGEPIRIMMNRDLLDRALRLGFTELGFSGVESPLVCRDQGKTYIVQPPTGGSPIEPGASVTRIESSTAAGGEKRTQPRSETLRTTVNETVRRNGHQPAMLAETNGRQSGKPVETNGHMPTRPAVTSGTSGDDQPGISLAALIKEAEELHAALGDVKSRTARLIAGLRRQRKQSRLLSDTLKSLRQLKLVEAVG